LSVALVAEEKSTTIHEESSVRGATSTLSVPLAKGGLALLFGLLATVFATLLAASF